jgi:hypothetical protein
MPMNIHRDKFVGSFMHGIERLDAVGDRGQP